MSEKFPSDEAPRMPHAQVLRFAFEDVAKLSNSSLDIEIPYRDKDFEFKVVVRPLENKGDFRFEVTLADPSPESAAAIGLAGDIEAIAGELMGPRWKLKQVKRVGSSDWRPLVSNREALAPEDQNQQSFPGFPALLSIGIVEALQAKRAQ